MSQVISPRVSVIIPNFNGELFLISAIDSILNQTYNNYEIIVIDDGSIDSSLEILKGFGNSIKLITKEHSGLASTLNLGLRLANGEYIARMDADDIAVPNRLEEQVKFLESNLEVGVVGSQAVLIDEYNRPVGHLRTPTNDLQIRWKLLYTNPLIHSSIMFRKNVLGSMKYDTREKYKYVEDYKLWTMLERKTSFSNINHPLICYRLHSKQVSTHNRDFQLENHIRLSNSYTREVFPEFQLSLSESASLCGLFVPEIKELNRNKFDRMVGIDTYLRLWGHFSKKYYSHKDLRTLQRKVIMSVAKLSIFRIPAVSFVEIFFKAIKM